MRSAPNFRAGSLIITMANSVSPKLIAKLVAFEDSQKSKKNARLDNPKGYLMKPDFKRKEQTVAHYATADAGRRPSISMLGGGKWNRRFFSIQSTDLVYQADENAPIKGSVDLKDVERLEESVVLDAPPFSFDLRAKDRLFTLSAENEQEMLLWALALVRVAPKLMLPEPKPDTSSDQHIAQAGANAKAAALSVPEPAAPPVAPTPTPADPATTALEEEMAAAMLADKAPTPPPAAAPPAAAAPSAPEKEEEEEPAPVKKPAETLKEKVDELWATISKDAETGAKIERLACWSILLADQELATFIGKGNAEEGKKLLEAMKEVRALDTSRDGFIDEQEFQRLNLPEVREAAEAWLDPASHQAAIRIQNIKRKKDAQATVAAKKAERAVNAPAASAPAPAAADEPSEAEVSSSAPPAAKTAPAVLPADNGATAEAFDESAAMNKYMSDAASQQEQEQEQEATLGSPAAPAPVAPSTEAAAPTEAVAPAAAAAAVEASSTKEAAAALTVNASGEELGEMTLDFSLAGPMGMDLGDLTLEVKGVSSGGQADELGVGVGWLVKAVNGVPVALFNDFLGQVTAAKASMQGPEGTASVTFVMPSHAPLLEDDGASIGGGDSSVNARLTNGSAVNKDKASMRESVFGSGPGDDDAGDPDDANMEGYMLKKGDNLLNPWQSRWFAARGHYLKYYKNLGVANNPKNIQAAIDLHLVDVQTAKGRTFHLKLKSGKGSDIILRAESDKAAAKWVEALRLLQLGVDGSTKVEGIVEEGSDEEDN